MKKGNSGNKIELITLNDQLYIKKTFNSKSKRDREYTLQKNMYNVFKGHGDYISTPLNTEDRPNKYSFYMEYFNSLDYIHLTDLLYVYCITEGTRTTQQTKFMIKIIQEMFKFIYKIKSLYYSHCDLHLENIIVNRVTSKIKILDFGKAELNGQLCSFKFSLPLNMYQLLGPCINNSKYFTELYKIIPIPKINKRDRDLGLLWYVMKLLFPKDTEKYDKQALNISQNLASSFKEYQKIHKHDTKALAANHLEVLSLLEQFKLLINTILSCKLNKC